MPSFQITTSINDEIYNVMEIKKKFTRLIGRHDYRRLFCIQWLLQSDNLTLCGHH